MKTMVNTGMTVLQMANGTNAIYETFGLMDKVLSLKEAIMQFLNRNNNKLF